MLVQTAMQQAAHRLLQWCQPDGQPAGGLAANGPASYSPVGFVPVQTQAGQQQQLLPPRPPTARQPIAGAPRSSGAGGARAHGNSDTNLTVAELNDNIQRLDAQMKQWGPNHAAFPHAKARHEHLNELMKQKIENGVFE